jgi:hypothetical protein
MADGNHSCSVIDMPHDDPAVHDASRVSILRQHHMGHDHPAELNGFSLHGSYFQ